MSLNPFEQLQHIQKEIEAFNIADQNLLEEFRIRFLGSKNVLKPISASIREIPNERKKEFGQLVNAIKNAAEQKYASHQNSLKEHSTAKGQEDMDLTAPGFPLNMGARHPLAITLNKIIKIFEGIGFSVAEDREIEDDWHNFTAMNTPEDHPARDMQDTYYLKNSSQYLLRTHTSSVQARVMEQHQPPIRIIAPGRVYRNETISARSHAQFHQVEGLYIDEKVSFADLKQTLLYFAKEMYGAKTQIRLRPSFFPFTEPSAEMDVSCFICNAEGCNICKYSGWVEEIGRAHV